MTPAELTAKLVSIDSTNPSLVPDAPGERQAAFFLAGLLADWGFQVSTPMLVDGRFNVVARAGTRTPEFRSLLLNGHLDVVGTHGMTHAPFEPTVVDGRMYGRGSADMKSGIAAICIAARDAVAQGIAGEVIVALVIDEEYLSKGTRALVEAGIAADAGVIAEPTRLSVCPAHRGFAWVTMEVLGLAAHGSRYDVGVDAITNAALIIAELDRYQTDELHRRTHQLLGRGSLHMSTIAGGTGPSTYPASCTVQMERRMLPGETGQDFADEIHAAIDRVRVTHPDLKVVVSEPEWQPASDVPTDQPIVRELSAAIVGEHAALRVEGLSAWTDAALLNAAGIPTVCFGPGDIALAHAATEFVPLREIDIATNVLTRLVHSWCNTRR